MDYDKLMELAVKLAYRKGQRDTLNQTMTRIYDSRFDIDKSPGYRQAMTEVWFLMQAEYLEHDVWVKATQESFKAMGFSVN